MKTLHEALRTYIPWYDRWHTYTYSNAISWGLFGGIAVSATLILVFAIEGLSLPIDGASQAGAVAGSRGKSQAVLVEKDSVKNLRALTNTALAKAEAHAREKGDKKVALEALKTALAERKNTLVEMAKTDPASVKGFLFDARARESFPEAVRDLLEVPVEKTGTYRMAVVTTEFHEHTDDISLMPHEEGYEEYFLERGDSERYQLYLTPEEAYHIPPETKVTLTGVDLGNNRFVLTEPLEEASLTALTDDLELLTEASTLTAATPGTIKKVAIVAFNFANNASAPLTVDEMRKRAFTNTNSGNGFYKENSYGQWALQGRDSVSGDIYGWVTIPMNADGTCNYSAWSTKARDMLVAQGANFTGYTNIQYVFPGGSTGCSWAGWAYIPGSTSWVRAEYFDTRIISHELGHNFGFHHAASYGCSVAVNTSPSTCNSSEYGDPYDVMGNVLKHTNAYNKAKYWLTSAQTQTVTSAGSYTLEPIELPSTGVKAIRVKRPFTSSLGSFSDGYYQIEQRTQYGSYGYSSTDTVLKGVVVRLVGDYTYSGRKTFYVRKLLVGESLTDAEAGITLTLESVSTTSAQVRVDMKGPECIRYAPSVTVSPVSSWVTAGTLAPYTVNVRNNDSTGCTASNFTVNSVLPSGFTQTPSTLSLSVSPQSQMSGTVTLLSPLTASVGTYPVTFTATHGVTGTVGQTIANYNVITPDLTAPQVSITQPTDGGAFDKKRPIITATASDASGVAKIEIKLDGSLVKTCTNVTSCSYTPNKRNLAVGTHTVEVIATDSSTSANKGTAKITATR